MVPVSTPEDLKELAETYGELFREEKKYFWWDCGVLAAAALVVISILPRSISPLFIILGLIFLNPAKSGLSVFPRARKVRQELEWAKRRFNLRGLEIICDLNGNVGVYRS